MSFQNKKAQKKIRRTQRQQKDSIPPDHGNRSLAGHPIPFSGMQVKQQDIKGLLYLKSKSLV